MNTPLYPELKVAIDEERHNAFQVIEMVTAVLVHNGRQGIGFQSEAIALLAEPDMGFLNLMELVRRTVDVVKIDLRHRVLGELAEATRDLQQALGKLHSLTSGDQELELIAAMSTHAILVDQQTELLAELIGAKS